MKIMKKRIGPTKNFNHYSWMCHIDRDFKCEWSEIKVVYTAHGDEVAFLADNGKGVLSIYRIGSQFPITAILVNFIIDIIVNVIHFEFENLKL